ncbi:CpsB/CapC family capsule biosynthesis tyrosine phosphatase [Psychrobacillus sp. FJAT-51614]|uniref:Tyrosine-protein phosphatase n=1 Tax=Psychrobacillus mangrovi TaxID=3117745 RepID=A0ABU8F1D4_9BACI
MVDIHAHILPGVDDGPGTLIESIELIKQALKEGITDIISTSHAYNPHYDVSKNTVLEKIELLKNEMEKQNLSINIHSGQEIRIQDSTIERLKSEDALTLAKSKYVLLELPTSSVPVYTVKIIQEILNLNKVPIIAHPERNRAIAEKPSRLLKLINHGAIAQITAGSLSGHFGRNIQKLSLQLVDANLVHTYGSDVHNTKTRPLLFDKGLSYLEKHKRLDAVDIFLENNARIVENEEVIILEPKEPEKAKWWSLVM